MASRYCMYCAPFDGTPADRPLVLHANNLAKQANWNSRTACLFRGARRRRPARPPLSPYPCLGGPLKASHQGLKLHRQRSIYVVPLYYLPAFCHKNLVRCVNQYPRNFVPRKNSRRTSRHWRLTMFFFRVPVRLFGAWRVENTASRPVRFGPCARPVPSESWGHPLCALRNKPNKKKKTPPAHLLHPLRNCIPVLLWRGKVLGHSVLR